MKKYSQNNANNTIASEPAAAYASLHKPFKMISKINTEDKHIFLDIIRKGLDYTVLDDFMLLADLHLDEMADLLHINSRTIRRMSTSEPINTDLSEKLIDLIRLYKLGHEVFGDTLVFNQWMKRNISGIGHARPIDIVDTAIGVEIVSDELNRLAFGVYS